MKYFVLLAALLFATAAFPQSANVIELSADDATAAKTAYDNLQAAQKAWSNAQSKIRNKYIDPGLTHCSGGHTVPTPCRAVLEFGSGFEFSQDFRFIVPRQSISGNCLAIKVNGGLWNSVPCADPPIHDDWRGPALRYTTVN